MVEQILVRSAADRCAEQVQSGPCTDANGEYLVGWHCLWLVVWNTQTQHTYEANDNMKVFEGSEDFSEKDWRILRKGSADEFHSRSRVGRRIFREGSADCWFGLFQRRVGIAR